MDWNSVSHNFWNEYSIKNVVCDACSGKLQVAPRALKLERRAICAECEYKNRYGFCTKCGCKISWKTSFTKCKCPVNKW